MSFDRSLKAMIDIVDGYFSIYKRDNTKSGKNNKECLFLNVPL